MKKPQSRTVNDRSLVFAQFLLKQFEELDYASVLPLKSHSYVDNVVLRRSSGLSGGYSQVRLTLDYNTNTMSGHCSIHDFRGVCTFVGAVFTARSMNDLASKLHEQGILNRKEYKNT